MFIAVWLWLRRVCLGLLLFGVWLAPCGVNRVHAQNAQAVNLQLTASVAGEQPYELGARPRPERQWPKLVAPLTLTIAGAGTFIVPYLVAALTDLWVLLWESLASDADGSASCTACKTSRTMLIPVAGPLMAAGDRYNPFSRTVSIALGVTQAAGLVLAVAGLVWLSIARPHDQPRRGLRFGMMAAPLPGGGMVGMRVALGSDVPSTF